LFFGIFQLLTSNLIFYFVNSKGFPEK